MYKLYSNYSIIGTYRTLEAAKRRMNRISTKNAFRRNKENLYIVKGGKVIA